VVLVIDFDVGVYFGLFSRLENNIWRGTFGFPPCFLGFPPDGSCRHSNICLSCAMPLCKLSSSLPVLLNPLFELNLESLLVVALLPLSGHTVKVLSYFGRVLLNPN
jgi:hypothetical protein